MRALWNCGKWELRTLQQEQTGLALILLIMFMFMQAGNIRVSEMQLMLSTLLSMVLVALAVVRSTQWLFGEAFVLERTSARRAWQSIGGRLLGWGILMAGGELVRQIFLWITMERDIEKVKMFEEIGISIFGPEEAAKWLGPRAFLIALCLAMGIYVLALTVCLLMKCSGRRHRIKMVDAASSLVSGGALIGSLWNFFHFPLVPVAALCILLGLPLSCWLLEYKAE